MEGLLANIKLFLVMALLGGATGWFFFAVLKRQTFGKQWGAIITGFIGAYLGHLALKGVLSFLKLPFTEINVVAALVGAVLLVWILTKVSP